MSDFTYDVFISCSRSDFTWARTLSKALASHHFSCWPSPDAPTAPHWTSETLDALTNSSVCILLFTPFGNRPCYDESVYLALSERVARTHGEFRVIPLFFHVSEHGLLTYNEKAPIGQIENLECPFYWASYLTHLWKYIPKPIELSGAVDYHTTLKKLILLIRGVDKCEDSPWFGRRIQQRIADAILNMRTMHSPNAALEKGDFSESDVTDSFGQKVPKTVDSRRAQSGYKSEVHSRHREPLEGECDPPPVGLRNDRCGKASELESFGYPAPKTLERRRERSLRALSLIAGVHSSVDFKEFELTVAGFTYLRSVLENRKEARTQVPLTDILKRYERKAPGELNYGGLISVWPTMNSCTDWRKEALSACMRWDDERVVLSLTISRLSKEGIQKVATVDSIVSRGLWDLLRKAEKLGEGPRERFVVSFCRGLASVE